MNEIESNKNIKPNINQKAIPEKFKIFVYIYMIIYIVFYYAFKVITLQLNPLHFIIFMYRLLHLVIVLYPNKVMKIGKQYRFQLYMPSFPSKPFFYALEKFNPKNKKPGAITVVFSMTKACPYKCPHCYQRNDRGAELDIEILKNVARDMQDIGVSMFDIEGGEPLVRFDRLIELLNCFDERAELWVNTTGHKLSEDQVQKLKDAKVHGVMISIHTTDKNEYDKFTGVEGAFDTAKRAIMLFQNAGLLTAINYCPRAENIKNGEVEKMMELAKELNCTLVQVIHAKPSGGWLYEKDEIYTSDELMNKLINLNFLYNRSPMASNYPSILFQIFEEAKNAFGCTAGGIDRFYLNHEGEVQPCEFLNVSFGNVTNEPFKVIFERMRSYFKTPGTNWLCCTEAHSIGEAMKKYELTKTPLPREITEEIVKKWDKGEPTPVYRKLKIYE